MKRTLNAVVILGLALANASLVQADVGQQGSAVPVTYPDKFKSEADFNSAREVGDCIQAWLAGMPPYAQYKLSQRVSEVQVEWKRGGSSRTRGGLERGPRDMLRRLFKKSVAYAVVANPNVDPQELCDKAKSDLRTIAGHFQEGPQVAFSGGGRPNPATGEKSGGYGADSFRTKTDRTGSSAGGRPNTDGSSSTALTDKEGGSGGGEGVTGSSENTSESAPVASTQTADSAPEKKDDASKPAAPEWTDEQKKLIAEIKALGLDLEFVNGKWKVVGEITPENATKIAALVLQLNNTVAVATVAPGATGATVAGATAERKPADGAAAASSTAPQAAGITSSSAGAISRQKPELSEKERVGALVSTLDSIWAKKDSQIKDADSATSVVYDDYGKAKEAVEKARKKVADLPGNNDAQAQLAAAEAEMNRLEARVNRFIGHQENVYADVDSSMNYPKYFNMHLRNASSSQRYSDYDIGAMYMMSSFPF